MYVSDLQYEALECEELYNLFNLEQPCTSQTRLERPNYVQKFSCVLLLLCWRQLSGVPADAQYSLEGGIQNN